MAILNLGSINIDHVYQVPHLPQPGETLAALRYSTGLGGKGANHSIAIARAGGTVRHLGAVGPEGDWCVTAMERDGVDVTHVARIETPTGHAIINVDPSGENAIVIFDGANRQVTEPAIIAALDACQPGDWLLIQNETNATAFAVAKAKARGLRTACAAAPFDADMVARVLPHLDLLSMNEVEADALQRAIRHDIDIPRLLITRGAKGATYRQNDREVTIPAVPVTPVDTTGAGDTFLGYFLAGIDSGQDTEFALHRAARASALQVTRPGAAAAIPTAAEVAAFAEGED